MCDVKQKLILFVKILKKKLKISSFIAYKD